MLLPEPFLVFTRKFNQLGVRHMIAASGDSWDMDTLDQWIREYQIESEWGLARVAEEGSVHRQIDGPDFRSIEERCIY